MMNINVHEVFEQLAHEPGRNAKLAILRSYVNDNLLRHVIFLALDPFTQFYIRKIPAYTSKPICDVDLWEAMERLELLRTRQITGNAAIDMLRDLLTVVQPDDAKVIERIIEKDLRCGVSEATVNAVWPGLIPEYPCMLASAFDQKLVDKVSFPAYAQLKLDGMRFNAIVRNGVVEFRSRNGKEININDALFGLPFIQMAYVYGADCVFDGELLVVDGLGEVLDRKTGNGILNKAVKGTQSKEEGSMVRATLWDIIPLDKFEQGKDATPYDVRLSQLVRCVDKLGCFKHLVDIVETTEVSYFNHVQSLFEKYLAYGREGLILKSKDMIWENKRSKHQIKFKGELECDLKVVAWEEGTGKNKGRLGALVLESADGLVKTNVGTGFTDEDRNTFTAENSVGKIVAIKYNARITDKRTGQDSLFLPVFIEFRDDKDVADTSKGIK